MKDIDENKIVESAVNVIKTAILKSQARALEAVNHEQLALYYGIGRFVSINTRNKNWGNSVVKSISERLKTVLPGLRGFSETNLKNMRKFYETWQCLEPNSSVTTDELEDYTSIASDNADNQCNEIRQLRLTNYHDFPVVAFLSISFTHHVAIAFSNLSMDERKFYIQYCYENKLVVDALESSIKGDLYHHQAEMPNNFVNTMPDHKQAFRAIRMFKDEYLLDFINTEELGVRDEDIDERIIENSIVHNVKNFIMAFGKGFSFIGNQVHCEKFGHDHWVDLLFFNRELKSLVVFELKNGDFKPAYLGQLSAYLRILNDDERKKDENAPIGIILCKKADKAYVEYVMQDFKQPMGVATYKTLDDNIKKVLPPKEQLEKLLEGDNNKHEK